MAALAVLISLAAAPASAQSCPDTAAEPSAVEVTTSFAEPSYDNSLTRAELAKRRGLSGPVLAGKTDIDTRTETQTAISYVEAPGSDGICYSISKIAVELAADRIDVFVAAEYVPGSCQHDLTLAHEHQHVEIERAALAAYADLLRQELRRGRFRGTSWAPSSDVASRQTTERVQRVVSAVMAAKRAVTEPAHEALDSPANQERESARCAQQ